MKCQNCGEHEATVKWIGDGGVLGLTHGQYANWCEICSLRAQLEYAKLLAGRISGLELELTRAQDNARE